METSIFDYDLPEDRIAQVPLPRRESSRMLLLKGQLIEDRRFEDFPDLLKADDCVVFNDSRVFPARLRDGTTEILFLRHIGEHTLWEALCKPARRFRPGTTAHLKGLEFKVEPPSGHYGKRMLRLLNKADLLSELSRVGEPPLPPYIHRHGDPALRSMDVERYQTIFAKNPGSAAAPTAGLHFPQEMIRRIEEKCTKLNKKHRNKYQYSKSDRS